MHTNPDSLGFSFYDSKSCVRVVVGNPLDQVAAAGYCRGLNVRSSLVRPQSPDEERKIYQLLAEAGGSATYLPMNYDAVTGYWLWNHDGTPVVLKRN